MNTLDLKPLLTKENMTTSFKHTKAAVVQPDIDRFETAYGVSLPNDYKAHLLRFNGGVPEKNKINIGDAVDLRIAGFYSLTHGTNTLESITDMLKVWEKVLPEHLVPIAFDGGAGQICLSVSDEDRGSTWLYYPDTEELTFLSASFSEFLEALHD